MKVISYHSLSQRGQSLVEVIVASAALVFVLVAVVSGMILAVRNASYANQQAQATKYSQEAIEMFRHFQLALGWETFYEEINRDSIPNSFNYCLPTIINESTPEDAADSFRALTSATVCTTFIPDTLFIREIRIEKDTVNQPIIIEARVSWVDGGRNNVAFSRAELYPRF